MPTEAEWEYAARGGKTSKIHTEYAGNNNPNVVAWNDKNNNYETKPVGLKFPNRLGLYDMSGNVYEWCWDRFADSYYAQFKYQDVRSNHDDPEINTDRVMRGGSWDSGHFKSRAVYRINNTPDDYWNNIGFRLLFAL